MDAGRLSRILAVSTSLFLPGLLVGADCDAYRMDFDMYEVCKKRGLPARESTRGGFSFRPRDTAIASAPLPPECRDGDGEPTWRGAPDVVEWTYCDNLNSGCEYYLFVEKFTSLDDLRLRDTLSNDEKVRAFIQACRQSTFGGAHALAYVGTFPISAYEFLDALFSTQSGYRPKDAFGFDGMRRQALALAPAPEFKLESFLFDTSLQPAVRTLNGVIREFESFRKPVMPEAEELARLQRVKTPSISESDRRRELEQNQDVLFIRAFNEEHAKGIFRDKKTSNAAAANALEKALPLYSKGDARRERFEEMAQRLRAALKDFDHRVDAAVDSLSRHHSDAERVYHSGDVLYLFFKGTGSTNPHLRLGLTIRQHGVPAKPSVGIEQPLGIVTRAFDDPPELNRQQNVVFAVDYQRYWVSFFTLPMLVADAASSAAKGVVENRALVAQVPGDYVATLELFDETTKSTSKMETRFSVIP